MYRIGDGVQCDHDNGTVDAHLVDRVFDSGDRVRVLEFAGLTW